MRVISRRALELFAGRHPAARRSLDQWYHNVSRMVWRNIQDVRRVYLHADLVTVRSGRTVVVFNVGGNKCRLITAIHYNTQKIFLLRVFTHREYDQQPWKDQL